jgi:hypothetical protein
MICPYRTANLTEKQYIKRNYTEDDKLEGTTIVVTTQQFNSQECLTKGCGAWHDEKCNYKS